MRAYMVFFLLTFQVPEMIEYARMDTHYLIEIFHRMKDALIDKGNEQNNLLKAVYNQSSDLCKSP